ncbi:MAG: hypothetical protein IJ846_05425 [Alphaproteobacteria bacterium]|nr:hypothetical protein [Alphaproteobacteria bacterium]
MRIKHLFFMLGASVVGLTSCTLYRSNIKETDRISDKIQSNLEQPYKPSEQYKMDTISVKDDIWLGNQSVRVNEGDPLPARFETEDGITLVSTAPVSLMQISEQITSLTGITVRIDDMILNEVRSAVQGADAAQGQVSGNDAANLFMPSYSGKLSGLLDQIVSRFALWWRYKNGVISFYKMETRVFTVYALPVTSNLSANIAGTASGDGGGTTSASMSSSIELDFWTQLESAVSAMLPEGATMNVIPTNGTITVTAPPSTLQRISQYVNSMNERLARQVAISVKVLNVSLADTNSIGLQISSVLKFLNEKMNITLTSSAQSAGSLGMTLVPGDRHIGTTNLIFDALNTQGTTTLVTSASVTTLNNRIAPIQISTNESYVEKIETTMNSDTTSVSITPAKINYGFTMEVLPRILDHGRLLMMFTMTLTQLEAMGKASGGDTGSTEGGNNDTERTSTTVQLPKIRTRGFVQEIAMTSGSTLMLTGFEEVNTSTSKSSELFGANASADKNRNVMVILLTPEVLISPLSPETRMRDL